LKPLPIGSDFEECWCSSPNRSWFGHQSRFVLPTPAMWLNGHLPALSSLTFVFMARLVFLCS
jgi:hypothetical protein